MRQQYNMNISKVAFLICMPRNMACMVKLAEVSVACCFKAVIHEWVPWSTHIG